MTQKGTSRSGLRPAQRALLLGAALALALWSIADYRSWAAERQRLLEILEETGLANRRPEVAERIGREHDQDWARIETARTLLVDQLDLGWLSELPPEEQALEAGRSSERLNTARELAFEGLVARPASWQAATVIGGATYLELTRRRDPRVLSEPELWREPLRAARELGPGETDADRFLAAGNLSLWSALSPAEKEEVQLLLRTAFLDPVTFGHLIDSWLRLAPSLDEAYAVVPDTPFAWARLKGIYARRSDWQRYQETHERWRGALLADFGRRLDDTERRLTGGDLQSARSESLRVATSAPVELAFAPAFARAMTLCPPGPFGPRHAAKLGLWLDWSLKLCFYGECPLPEPVIARLAASVAGLEEHQIALAALAIDNLAQGERHERFSNESAWSEAWGPYFMVKARLLLERGEVEEASKALLNVHPTWLDSLAFWEVRQEIDDQSGNRDGEAERLLAGSRHTAWPARTWVRRGESSQLELLPSHGAAGLRVELEQVPPGGAVVEVHLDGRSVAIAAVRAGSSLEIAAPVDSGIHLLELHPLAGGSVLPGPVSLLE